MRFTEIRLQRSRWLLAVLAIAHLGALIITLSIPLNPWLCIGTAISILASLAHCYWHHFLRRSHHAVLGLSVTRDGLKVETRSHDWIPAKILGNSFVSPWLTVLNLKLPSRRLTTHVVLLPDMLGPDEFRRLRTWLKWGDALTHGKDGDAVL